jgi:hypothetical protein
MCNVTVWNFDGTRGYAVRNYKVKMNMSQLLNRLQKHGMEYKTITGNEHGVTVSVWCGGWQWTIHEPK